MRVAERDFWDAAVVRDIPVPLAHVRLGPPA